MLQPHVFRAQQIRHGNRALKVIFLQLLDFLNCFLQRSKGDGWRPVYARFWKGCNNLQVLSSGMSTMWYLRYMRRIWWWENNTKVYFLERLLRRTSVVRDGASRLFAWESFKSVSVGWACEVAEGLPVELAFSMDDHPPLTPKFLIASKASNDTGWTDSLPRFNSGIPLIACTSFEVR